MKRYLLAIILVLIFSVAVFAQGPGTSGPGPQQRDIAWVTSAPTGSSCVLNRLYIVKSSGAQYMNILGTCTKVGSGTGGVIPSLVQGDILYASAANTLSALAKSTSATRYLSNTGSSNNPAWAQINLANGVTGDLPFSSFVQSTAASKLVGRGSAGGAGDYEEITIGTGLSMSGTTLSSSGITNSAGANIIPKSDGTNLVASGISEVGTATKVQTVGSFSAGDVDGNNNQTRILVNDLTQSFDAGSPGAPAYLRLTGSTGVSSIGDVTGINNGTKITLDDFAQRISFIGSLKLGATDAASPVAQTISVQNVVAGTSNTAGANLTINGSQGTGTGTGGSIIFKTAAAGGSGTSQNSLATALTLGSDLSAVFGGAVSVSGSSFGLTGNISGAGIFGTSGIRYKNVASTLTDTTSSGTVATNYTNVFGNNTLAATNATVITNAFNTYIADPIAGSNVTLTNKWALGADSIKIGTSNQFSVGNAGHVTVESVTSTGATGTGNFVFSASPTLTGTPSVTSGTLVDGTSALSVSATLSTVIAAGNTGTTVQITGAGSSFQTISAAKISLLAGYTGSASTFGVYAQNQTAGTSANEFSSAQAANYGEYIATTTGTVIGQAGYASGGNKSYGGFFRAIVAKNSAANIGVGGFGLNTGSAPVSVGGFFGLMSSAPTYESAALIADNGATSSPIFIARDNGTAVLTVADGGGVTLTGAESITSTTDSTTTTSGALQVAGGAAIRKRVFIDGITTSAGLQTAVLCQSSGGEMIADSVACLASSARFKNRIKPLNSGLNEILSLRPVSFFYKPEGIFATNQNFQRERVGLIAEDVAKIDSRLVGFEKDNITPRTVGYEQIVPVLIKAVQEQQKEIEGLKRQVADALKAVAATRHHHVRGVRGH